jgi:hypothetical protein
MYSTDGKRAKKPAAEELSAASGPGQSTHSTEAEANQQPQKSWREPDPRRDVKTDSKGRTVVVIENRDPVVVNLAQVKREAVQWLWPGRFPLGKVSLVVGKPGAGKSLLATELVAHVTTGRPWPDGTPCPLGSALILAAEDDPADTIRPRLEAAGADVGKAHFLRYVRVKTITTGGGVFDDKTTALIERPITLSDYEELKRAIKAIPDCRLVVIDPLTAFLEKGDSNSEVDARNALGPLAMMAAELGIAVVIVGHLRKAPSLWAADLVLGSRAILALSRSAWLVTEDPEREGQRLLLPLKMNLGPPPPGFRFAISGEPPRISWGESVNINPDELLARQFAKPGPSAEKLAEVQEALQSALASGPRLAAEVMKELKAAGYSERTIRRAKESSGVQAYRESVRGPWYWRLPKPETESEGIPEAEPKTEAKPQPKPEAIPISKAQSQPKTPPQPQPEAETKRKSGPRPIANDVAKILSRLGPRQ